MRAPRRLVAGAAVREASKLLSEGLYGWGISPDAIGPSTGRVSSRETAANEVASDPPSRLGSATRDDWTGTGSSARTSSNLGPSSPPTPPAAAAAGAGAAAREKVQAAM